MVPALRVIELWRSFRHSLLFTPAWMTLGALLVFALTSRIDAAQTGAVYALLRRMGDGAFGFLVFTGSSGSALSLLSSLVGTWATIVGVVFSITLVTIQLSATKYSAQVVSLFERDKLNQAVLGAFTATFVYSLLVLKTVRTEEGATFVPLVGTNLAVLLAIVSIFLLIAFIGNLAAYMRPTRFVEDFASRGRRLVPDYNVPRKEDGWRPVPATQEPAGGASARAPASGKLVCVDWEKLRDAMAKEDPPPERVEVLAPIGWAVTEGDELLRVHGADEAAARRLARACVVEGSAQRESPALVTETLADVAVTALSGGATDVGVAKAALRGLLGIAAAGLEEPELPQAFLVDAGEGRPVLVCRRQTPAHLLAFQAMERIVHKARRERYWDVAEEMARHVGPVLRQAAGTTAWPETLAWSRGVVAWLVRMEDDAARARVLADLGAIASELRRAGQEEAATHFALQVQDVAEEAGAGDLARGALAPPV